MELEFTYLLPYTKVWNIPSHGQIRRGEEIHQHNLLTATLRQRGYCQAWKRRWELLPNLLNPGAHRKSALTPSPHPLTMYLRWHPGISKLLISVEARGWLFWKDNIHSDCTLFYSSQKGKILLSLFLFKLQFSLHLITSTRKCQWNPLASLYY